MLRTDAVEGVWITAAASAHPASRFGQDEAAARIVAEVGNRRRVEALARGSQIESRAAVLPADRIAALGSIQERNEIYEAEAPRLALSAAHALCRPLNDVSYLITTSCTGYMIPGLDVELATRLGLAPQTVRLPITEAGCAGGVVALARAVEGLRLKASSGLVVAAELCSLAFHADCDEGNLTSAMLFADGAGAVHLRSGERPESGIEVVDAASFLVPDSRDILGFRLTNQGLFPVLDRSLVERLTGPCGDALCGFLSQNGLRKEDIAFWLIHPGGPRVLSAIEAALDIEPERIRWSWQTLRASGNTSSAAIIEVLERYMDDPSAPGGWGVAVAFGPGMSIEMLLLRC